jgi:hypothetical protein
MGNPKAFNFIVSLVARNSGAGGMSAASGVREKAIHDWRRLYRAPSTVR